MRVECGCSLNTEGQQATKKLCSGAKYQRPGFAKCLFAVAAWVAVLTGVGCSPPSEKPPWTGKSMISLLCWLPEPGSPSVLTPTVSATTSQSSDAGCIDLPRPVLTAFPSLPVVLKSDPLGDERVELGLVGCLNKGSGEVGRIGLAERAHLPGGENPSGSALCDRLPVYEEKATGGNLAEAAWNNSARATANRINEILSNVAVTYWQPQIQLLL